MNDHECDGQNGGVVGECQEVEHRTPQDDCDVCGPGEPEKCDDPCNNFRCLEEAEDVQGDECEQPMKIGAEQVLLKMRIDNGTPEGIEEEVDMAVVMQTVWSIMMDLDQRVQAVEGGSEEEESPILMPPDIEI